MKKPVFLLILFTLVVSSLIATPKAIVFDLGSVMTIEKDHSMIDNFIKKSFNFSAKEFEKAKIERKRYLKKGDEEFWLYYAKRNKIHLPSHWTQSFETVKKKAITINHGMYRLVHELKKRKFIIGLLSNSSERHSGLYRDMGLYKPFSPCLISCNIGYTKPDPRAYKYLLSKLKLPASKIVFIDDRSENIAAAKKMGIDAILFQSEAHLRRALRARGVL